MSAVWTAESSVERWGMWELALTGPSRGNPYADIEWSAQFRCGDRVVDAAGFYDGDGVYRLRFMPDREGEWTYATRSTCAELDGIAGMFVCEPPIGNNRGPVGVAGDYHFAYADGTRYYPFGTTCYVWHLQGEELEERTLETLKHAPYNKVRMCVFPKHYAYNHAEPELYPFEGDAASGWDFTRFNPEYFRRLEFRVLNLLDLDIQADLILFHPYDKWGFSNMGSEADERYLKYVAARLSAYRNVWWSMANEYDLVKTKTTSDWDRLFRIIRDHDPYDRLRSIHNWHAPHVHLRSEDNFYDHAKPWVTHASVQHSDMFFINHWRDKYRKPIVVDECCYEGNLGHSWGNITAQELVHRCWEGYARGGYVGHGETYDADKIWWSHGGVLIGESTERIAFLRGIAEAGPRQGVAPIIDQFWDTACAGFDGEYYVVYFGNRQPASFTLQLPKDRLYRIERIDTWEMTVQELRGEYSGECRITLPTKPYMALRIQAFI